MSFKPIALEALAAAIADGVKLAVPADYAGPAMAATRALIARGARGLHLVCVPQNGLQADLLIGAGAVATIETSGCSLGESGVAPRFAAAIREARLRVLDATCAAIHAGLQAAQKGIPFMPLRGILGSDLLAHRPDWKVIENPFAAGDPALSGGDPIVVLPAIVPDAALFHAPFADREGNVFIGRRRELAVMAQAARRCYVTVEEIRDCDLLADPARAAGTLPAIYVTGVAIAPRGAAPCALEDVYEADEAAIARYAEAAQTAQGFADFLAGWLRAEALAA